MHTQPMLTFAVAGTQEEAKLETKEGKTNIETKEGKANIETKEGKANIETKEGKANVQTKEGKTDANNATASEATKELPAQDNGSSK